MRRLTLHRYDAEEERQLERDSFSGCLHTDPRADDLDRESPCPCADCQMERYGVTPPMVDFLDQLADMDHDEIPGPYRYGRAS